MNIGLIGQKCGMTRVFTDDGVSLPVTVVKVSPNRITQVKNLEKDGYCAVQVAFGKKANSKVNKPLTGHYSKVGVEAGCGLRELRVADHSAIDGFVAGAELKVDVFKDGDMIDVCGMSKGKGFAGVIKRHHFSSQDATHGNSLSHRAPGSIGQRQTPGRVFKGKKMAGHLGNVRRTIGGLEIVRVDVVRNLILIKGGVPGAPMGYVFIKPAAKQKRGKV